MALRKLYSNEKSQYPTTAPLSTLDFRVDAGVQEANTAPLVTLPKGSLVYGFRVTVTELVSTGSSPTVQFGFTGTGMLSTAVAAATLVVGYVFGNHSAGIATNSVQSAALVLSASDTFDCIVGTATLTTGKFDVTIFYHPPQDGAMDSSFKEFVTPAS